MSRTFVLVHGSCHAGWTWRPVAEHLRRQGHRVYMPTLTGLGTEDARADVHLADMVDYLVDYVETRDLTDIVLVGHSWGGFPISGASVRLASRISRLVYWSAFMPRTGETLIGLCPPAYGDMFRASAAESDDNSVIFSFEVFCAAFLQDASPETQRIVYPLLERHPFNSLNEPLDLDEFERLQLPSTYVLSQDDLALPPGELYWAPRFPDRLPGAPLIYTPGSHEAMFTQPEALANSFIEAADK
jgi:pimeloyl-ACP methyl ester carboxylesterase